jgi:protein-tyrosine phosphatase
MQWLRQIHNLLAVCSWQPAVLNLFYEKLAARQKQPVSTHYLKLPTADCQLTTIFAPMKILMVCLGNICRSPLAEGILQDKAFKAGLNWSVESAGTNGYHNGEAPHRLSQKVAKLNGIDISKQRSRRISPDDFLLYDKIYAMAEDVVFDMKRITGKKFDAAKVELLMNEVYPEQNREVPDPWYGEEAGYHEVYRMIEEACDAIVSKYSIFNDQYSIIK